MKNKINLEVNFVATLECWKWMAPKWSPKLNHSPTDMLWNCKAFNCGKVTFLFDKWTNRILVSDDKENSIKIYIVWFVCIWKAGILNYKIKFLFYYLTKFQIHQNICLERTHDSMFFTGTNNVRDKNHKINRKRNTEIIKYK